ncbi:hypothetical protein [Aeromonas veronii]
MTCDVNIYNVINQVNPNYLGATYLLYCFTVYALKSLVFKLVVSSAKIHTSELNQQYSIFSWLSIDYVFSSVFKERICFYQVENREETKAQLIKSYNLSNLLMTIVLCSLSYLSLVTSWFVDVFVWLCIIRFISRCLEITIAFSLDVMTEPVCYRKKAGSLNKYDRVALALKSYFEVYILSASLYIFTQTSSGIEFLKVLNMSLGVGTLTNTGDAIKAMASQPLILLVYLQILTTLTLVTMAFAIYIGRKK